MVEMTSASLKDGSQDTVSAPDVKEDVQVQRCIPNDNEAADSQEKVGTQAAAAPEKAIPSAYPSLPYLKGLRLHSVKYA